MPGVLLAVLPSWCIALRSYPNPASSPTSDNHLIVNALGGVGEGLGESGVVERFGEQRCARERAGSGSEQGHAGGAGHGGFGEQAVQLWPGCEESAGPGAGAVFGSGITVSADPGDAMPPCSSRNSCAAPLNTPKVASAATLSSNSERGSCAGRHPLGLASVTPMCLAGGAGEVGWRGQECQPCQFQPHCVAWSSWGASSIS